MSTEGKCTCRHLAPGWRPANRPRSGYSPVRFTDGPAFYATNMDVSPEVQQLAVNLATAAARNSAQMVSDKVKSLRAGKKHEETIAGLEEIVSALIDDKAELTRIAQAYQAELVAQRLTPGDVSYIADTILPTLEKIAEAQGAGGAQLKKTIDNVRPLLSVEMVTVMQLLGFNFRRAIGEPLTSLTERAILSRAPSSETVKVAELEREQMYMRVALDPDAFARLSSLLQ